MLAKKTFALLLLIALFAVMAVSCDETETPSTTLSTEILTPSVIPSATTTVVTTTAEPVVTTAPDPISPDKVADVTVVTGEYPILPDSDKNGIK